MLTLCGFSASNYYNKVKLALMEKQIAFEEELAWLGDTNPDESPCPSHVRNADSSAASHPAGGGLHGEQ